MKIAYGSDLHLEFGEFILNPTDADVLVLAGDIFVIEDIVAGMGKEYRAYQHFLAQVATRYKDVIYVMGNHEHYHGNIESTYRLLREFLPDFVHILEQSSVVVQGQRFVGATLWTDMGQGAPEVKAMVQYRMNDYRVIEDGLFPLEAGVTMNIHNNTMLYFEKTIKSSDVVVTHHLPSWKSVHSKYAHDKIMSCGYASHLDDFVLKHSPKLWFHGHSHEPQDYMVGETRVTSNPRGYVGYEPQSEGYKLKVITI